LRSATILTLHLGAQGPRLWMGAAAP